MKQLIRSILIIFAAVAAMLAAPAMAKNVTADLDQINEVMKGAGYKSEVKEKDGERYITVEASGYRFLLFAFGCDDAKKKCKSVQFFAVFNPSTKPTLEAMNTYARQNRWGRVYLDKDGDPAIEFDLDLEQGGMSGELFLDNVAYWEAIMVAFADFAFGKGDAAKK
ncbi:MAG: YbjN domain-containing protein [Novosphingobium sp.]|jgi:hypothetical protein|nr:YbjN domain-containing protein [Novosphingobium sp.]MBP6554175.1 YbjN domain-containing protein [Novosphingobium sp.]